ncbi:hypothetical protein V0R50_17340 [Pseudomonas sp. 148P]|uniref:Uncharacterized protein n=1 Tax=Pseudomonas ulcerans TaxID=3115852 RepID=A0ABU7HTX9_9PSED|nr:MULTISPECIES: hypothetical protein [unclassified Pseudomonas]MEE1925269.1 hypothetical protein [Pseudomonas sp. 147P]MEE1934995.1 hypothetical protein [Pseudomonas sp. 148P]
MTEQLRASVVGNALVSFFPDVDQTMRERVQAAMLFAQRATREVVASGQVSDGYDYYLQQLKFLGWDATSPREPFDPELQRRKVLDEMLARIGATAGHEFSTVTRWSLDTLELNQPALFRFEERSLQQAAFQLLPCRVNRPGYLDMVLYHETLEREERLSGFLFRERVVTGVRAELVRFNARLFEQQFGERVRQRLYQALLEEVCEL